MKACCESEQAEREVVDLEDVRLVWERRSKECKDLCDDCDTLCVDAHFDD